MRFLRVLLLWFVISAAMYALWQGPNWDRVPLTLALPLGTVLFGFQLPGMIIHGPHGGFGDWRDPATIIPVTALFYSACHMLLRTARHAWQSRRTPSV